MPEKVCTALHENADKAATERSVAIQCVLFNLYTACISAAFVIPYLIDVQRLLGIDIVHYYIGATILWQINHGTLVLGLIAIQTSLLRLQGAYYGNVQQKSSLDSAGNVQSLVNNNLIH